MNFDDWWDAPTSGLSGDGECEDGASFGPKINGSHFWRRLLDQLIGWPPGWVSWSSKLNDVKLMTGEF